MRDAARHVATKTLGNPHPPMRWVAGYAHMGRWAGKPSRKPRRPRPYSRHCGDSSHGIAQTIHTIPMGACRTQPKSARAVYPQSQCNKCETRHAFITKRRDKCAMRYDNCATRHATSLLRPMRPAPPSITLRVLGSKPLESRMDTGLGAIPNARCVRRATFAV